MSSADEDEVQSFYDARSVYAETHAWEDAVSLPDWPCVELNDTTTGNQSNSLLATPPAISRKRLWELNAQESYSLLLETVPALPGNFVDSGRDTPRSTSSASNNAPNTSQAQGSANSPPPPLTPVRPSTSGGEESDARRHGSMTSEASDQPRQTRRRTISSATANALQNTRGQVEGGLGGANRFGMSRVGKAKNEDLFLELANDQTTTAVRSRPASHDEPVLGHVSFADKRRSMPAENGLPSSIERRPKSSGYILGSMGMRRPDTDASELERHMDRYRSTPGRASFQADDATSVSSRSRSGIPQRYAVAPERPKSLVSDQLKSPELPQYGRRRPSFGTSPRQMHKSRPSQVAAQVQDTFSESPGDSSEPKRSLPDSASVDSETADTVWDELDDLKSRIKKLELTGKLPQTSGAAVSTEQNERPRTATTAPTTIDSSPKHEKPEKQEPKLEPEPQSAITETLADPIVGGPDAANTHPNLHAALAKAKALLNPSLYRSLEATATDALQLAIMTGSAGPQGTALTAAAIINGVTVSDRHVRRKADTMCRNLTDLCLALCEGKHEASSLLSSPVTLETPAKSSPSLRYSRSSLGPNDGFSRNASRPMSRLEARRTSMLGSQAGSSVGNSPHESGGEDGSAAEQESTASYPRIYEPRQLGRPVSRLQAARQRRYEEAGEDEDPTIRPASRAMTDIGRNRSVSSKEYGTPQRSPSFRETLAVRRANSGAFEGNRELARVASLTSDSSRRRFLDPSTPPVVEEEGYADEHQTSSQGKRRITSFGPYGLRRASTEVPHRASSLNQMRHVAVE